MKFLTKIGYGVLSLFVLANAVSATVSAAAGTKRELRVCADANNLPFSNAVGEGFENKLAELIATDLGATVTYTFAPQRRGFLRTTLNAGRCDVVMGVPTSLDMVATTRPYYRSAYVFVYGPEAPHVRSLDAPELRRLRIGVPLVGDDGANPPPVLALASRDLIDNMHAYSVYGDYRKPSPPAEIVRALRRREIDVALAWGPLAGYFAHAEEPALSYARIPEKDAPAGSTFAFDISVGVRRGDTALRNELNDLLARRRVAIDALLARYHVPRF
ncbi:MAG TPA: quinoprotein dehydrogenase-associated putative ABC transporter substrate-binding protein [Polyangiaceae bacterium]|jgi:mxaJ protein|nr:quinoprotein dehydrogenase-associated putative ABC transporter substrate-binding protein [Polyangiaceae bacterium]